jgi:hypothetical protein
MISRLIRDGKVIEIDVSKNDRLGFPPDTTLISEEHWSNLKDALSPKTDTENIRDSKVANALRVKFPEVS